MTDRRYTVVIARRATGVVWQFTVPLWPVVAVVVPVLTLPVLMGLGARWSARATIAQLEAQNVQLQMENASFRDATGELAGQISSLQSAVDDIGVRARVDPEAERAIARLPERVRLRAMGGASVTTPLLGGGFSEMPSA